MAKSTRMSDYELTRLERIKENQKMLEELFPEGVTSLAPKRIPPSRPSSTKKRRVTDTNSLGTESGSDCASERSHSDVEEEGCPRKRRSGYTVRKVKVYPRRNPTRQARKDSRPITRSVSKENSEGLMDGLEDDQEVKRTVYKTIRRHVSTEDDLPIELDDVAGFSSTRHIKVVDRSSDKIYDRVRGTTCHQCRQKTIDVKTVCHNKNCRGVRGQFCAPCLQNRYGEGLTDSLRDGKWVCPPCRKICNCSFCMPKRGKPPTGILIHHARDAGCGNVHEYLNKTNYDY